MSPDHRGKGRPVFHQSCLCCNEQTKKEFTALESKFLHSSSVKIVVLPRRYRRHWIPVYQLVWMPVRQWNSCHLCMNGIDFLWSCFFNNERLVVKCFSSKFTNTQLQALVRVKMNLPDLLLWSACKFLVRESCARHIHNSTFFSSLGLWFR